MNVQLADVEKTVQVVMDQFADQIGAGAVVKAVNAVMEILGVEKDDESGELYQVTQQMMTNYIRNGMIDKVKRSSMKGELVNKDDVLTWLTRYSAKKVGLVVSGGSSRGVAQSDIVARAREALTSTQPVKAVKASKGDAVAPAAPVEPKN